MNDSRVLGAGLLALVLGGPGCACADSVPVPKDVPYPGTIALSVDATDTERRVFSVHELIPVAAGPLVLLFPQWIPGRHGPSGSVERLAGLRLSANGAGLAWLRDTLNPFAFHVTVPDGVTQLQVDFDYLKTPDGEHDRTFVTSQLERVEWNEVVLYPAGYYAHGIAVAPTLRLPKDWQFATSLTVQTQAENQARFAPVSLNTLVDSPVLAGHNFRRVELDAGGNLDVWLDIAAERPEQMQIPSVALEAHRSLVRQAYRLFRSHHFERYDFLVSVSDSAGPIGLEHHRSSEDAVGSGYFTDWRDEWGAHGILAHEFTHSWNGKFRRPAELNTPGFDVPMQDGLLWMYEGQTAYWTAVLSTRAGMTPIEQTREELAEVAAENEDRAGRSWRSLQDTTNQPVFALARPPVWPSWQRGRDYYSEMLLVWLDADTLIRELSGDARSLDDFARAFFAGVDRGETVSTYDFGEIVATLNRVQPYDWERFLRSRLDSHDAAPLDGIRRSGWRLVFTDAPNRSLDVGERASGMGSFRDSIGLEVNDQGRIDRVRWDGPAYKAHIAPGMKLIAVNGRAFALPVLQDAIVAAKSGAPIDLLIRDSDIYRTVHVDYHDGLRYPHLVRIDGANDRLTAILRPLE